MGFTLEILDKAGPTEYKDIQKLAIQLGENHLGKVSGEQKYIEHVIDNHFAKIVVARDENARIVGMATVILVTKIAYDEAHIEDVVVDESMRGQGLGKAIMQMAIETAWSMGADKIELTSRASREAANALYQKLGFKLRKTNVYILKKGN